MSVLDVESLLAPVEEASPCGPSMAYDAAYMDLFRAAEGEPEHEMGDIIVAAEEPDWHDISERCLQLLVSTKDLRLILLLIRAQLKTEGLVGFHNVSGCSARHGAILGHDPPAARRGMVESGSTQGHFVASLLF